MDQKIVFLTLIGMMLVTYLPRLFPILFLSGRALPPLFVAWLRLVPPAVLAAMLFPSLLIHEEKISFDMSNLYFWAAVVAFPVAWKTKSLFATVLVGMGLVSAGRYFGIG